MIITASRTATTCSNCRISSRWFFHEVNLHGTDCRLCTSCVLRLHPSSFCPSCFEFFQQPLSSAASHRFISCSKCSSLTHLRCLPSPHPSPSTFLCPPCSSPSPSSFSFFTVPDSTPHQLDTSRAAVLLCAAKISAASIGKAYSVVRAKAERAVRESAAARNRARDSFRNFMTIEAACLAPDGSIEVSGLRNLGISNTNNPVNANSNVLSENNKNGFSGNNNGSAVSDDGKLKNV